MDVVFAAQLSMLFSGGKKSLPLVLVLNKAEIYLAEHTSLNQSCRIVNMTKNMFAKYNEFFFNRVL